MLFQFTWGPILPLNFSTFFEQLKQLKPFLTIIASYPSGSVKNKYNCIRRQLLDWSLIQGMLILFSCLHDQPSYSVHFLALVFWALDPRNYLCFSCWRDMCSANFVVNFLFRAYPSYSMVFHTLIDLYLWLVLASWWEEVYLYQIYHPLLLNSYYPSSSLSTRSSLLVLSIYHHHP